MENSLSLAGNAKAAFTLGGTAASTGYTQVQVGGQLSLGGASLALNVASGFALAVRQTFYLFDEPGSGTLAVAGTFGNAPGGIYTDAAGDTFLVDYIANDPADGSLLLNDVSVTVLSVVPEPGTWVLVGLGADGLAGPERAPLASCLTPVPELCGVRCQQDAVVLGTIPIVLKNPPFMGRTGCNLATD